MKDNNSVQDTIFQHILVYCYLHLLVYKPNLKYYFIYNKLNRYETTLLLLKNKMINKDVFLAIEAIINASNGNTLDTKTISDSLVKIYIRYINDNQISEESQNLYNLLMLVYSTEAELNDTEVALSTFSVNPFHQYGVIPNFTYGVSDVTLNKKIFTNVGWDQLPLNLRLQLVYIECFEYSLNNTLTQTPARNFLELNRLIGDNVLFYKVNTAKILPSMYYLEAIQSFDKCCITKNMISDLDQILSNPKLKKLYNIEFDSNLINLSKSFENLYNNVISLEADDSADDIDVGETDTSSDEEGDTSTDETDSDNIEGIDSEDKSDDDSDTNDVYLELDKGDSKTKLDDFIFRSVVARMNDSLQQQADPNVSGEDLSTLNSICKYWLWKIPTDTTKSLLKKLKLNSCLKGF